MRQRVKYADFDLEIDRVGDRYRAQVPDKELGEAIHFFDAPFASGELEDLLAALSPALRDAWIDRESPREVARKIGKRLFHAVFQGSVLHHWSVRFEDTRRHGKGLRLRLKAEDGEVIRWPWELLCDDQEQWIATSKRTPILRYLKTKTAIRQISAGRPVRFLVMVSKPEGSAEIQSDRELEAIEDALKPLHLFRQVEVERVETGDLDSLREKLRNPVHVFHFIGHGVSTREAGFGKLILEDDRGGMAPTSGSDLATLLRDCKNLGLVILNACEGGRISSNDPFSGVAQSLSRAGIPAVLAMQFPVSDQAAVDFTRELYRRFAEGCQIGEAVSEGRQSLLSKRFGLEWATPVLYMRAGDSPVIGCSVIVYLLRLLRRLATVQGASALVTSLLLLGNLLGGQRLMDWVEALGACPSSRISGIPFARIPEGRFTMGSKPRAKDEREHEVKISRPFCMGQTEVTVGQWRAVMGESFPDLDEDLPVSNVSWDDVQEFLRRLNEEEPGAGYRLPTEAEWEYAARAGSRAEFSFGNDSRELHRYGNCENRDVDDEFEWLAPVSTFRPNDWGLYDMHGNVSEWVSDWYERYGPERQIDPKGPEQGEEKVRRGGSYDIIPENCDAVQRKHSQPGYEAKNVGFRIVRNPLH
jgi:hypothetical protein